MPIRIVQLGTARSPGEGPRLGTVRRPPRGVRKDRYAKDNWFDVWLPQLAPSAQLVQAAQRAHGPRAWETFTKRYQTEMASPDNARLVEVLAVLSHHANFAVGCYCDDESTCHRSILRRILIRAGAKVGD